MKKERMTQAAASATEDIFPATEATQETSITQETQITQQTQQTPETSKKAGRPNERGETYRFSLYLDGDLKNYIKFAAWQRRQSTTQYLNELVRADMEAYLAAGGSADEWTTED